MNNMVENICIVLETEYQKYFPLPKEWVKIEDYHIRSELIGLALAKEIRIEELEEYKKRIEENYERQGNPR